MRRLCMDCGHVLGEKCESCGREIVVGLIDSAGGYCCPFCLKFGHVGDGGDTHGICSDCVEKRRRQLAAEKQNAGVPL